jgi:hypothetical protein
MNTKPQPRARADGDTPTAPKPARERKAGERPALTDKALARDDLPEPERVDHQNDLA